MVLSIILGTGPVARQVFTYLFAALIILLSLYHQILEVCQIIYYGFEYIYQLQNYVEFFVYILSIAFVFVFFNDCGCPKEWQWQIGVLAMLTAWTNVIFFAFKFPAIGIFVLIFYKIVITFLKVVLFSLVLILGFSFILLMVFHNPDSQVTSYNIQYMGIYDLRCYSFQMLYHEVCLFITIATLSSDIILFKHRTLFCQNFHHGNWRTRL